MNQEFLSLKEAAQHTGKSRSSLRRFVEKITKAADHPDRYFIKPNADEVTRLHTNKTPFSWLVNTKLLDREYAKEGTDGGNSKESDSQSTSANNELLSQTISMLKTELDEKNKQIAQFQERQRETNFLLQQTTEKLTSLTDGQKNPKKNEEAVTVYANQNGNQEGSQDDDKTDAAKPVSKKRKSLWDRLQSPVFARH